MSVPAVPVSATPSEDVPRGRQLGRWSLLMLPMLLVTAIVAGFLGMFLLGRRDLEGSEPMSVQGAYGWMVWALCTIIFIAPTAVGFVFGLQARRLGARGAGLAGMLVNGLIFVGYPTLSFVSLLGQ